MGRVFITGAGVVSPIGNNFVEFMEGVKSARKGIGRLTHFNSEYFPTNLAAEVKRLKIDPGEDRKEVFIRQAIAEIFENHPNLNAYEPEKRFLNLGAGLDFFDLSGYASSKNISKGQWQLYNFNTHTTVKNLAEKYLINGGFSLNVTACVASSQAIGLSYRMLKNSSNKIIISGGFDSMLNPLHYMGFYKLGALSNWNGPAEEACKPFDYNRQGLVLGEGAAVLVLENSENVTSAHALAEIAGYSSTMDSYLVSDPHPEGKMLAKAALNAISEAGIKPDQIDCVHLHGTGTEKNALAEAKAMQLIFPERYLQTPVFSLKGQTGHLIAACGAVEMLGVIYSLQKQQVPATVNFNTPDPDVPLRVLADKPLDMSIEYILKLNSAFGGQNTAFVVKKYGE